MSPGRTAPTRRARSRRRPVLGLVAAVLCAPLAAQELPPEGGLGPLTGAPQPAGPLLPVAASSGRPVFRSSLVDLVEAVAAALESRAAEEGVSGSVQLETTTGRGLDAQRTERVFTNRLRRRLRERGLLVPVGAADLQARVVLSLEGSRLWAVGLLEGGALPGPASLAVSQPMDRELETLFGMVAGQGRTRWVLERLGPIPTGVLDVALHDVDDDLVDDIVVLSVDGIRAFRYSPGDSRPEPIGEVVSLPGKRRWPRTVLGWMAGDRSGKLWVATSAGHRFVYEPKTGRVGEPTVEGVPLRQVLQGAQDRGPPMVFVRGWYGSPTLAQPVTSLDKRSIDPAGFPPFVRDVQRWPGRPIWAWVDEAGRVGAFQEGQRPRILTGIERSGDRIVLADLDGDGEGELTTSAARSPGEGDQLTLYRIDEKLSRQTVAYRSRLSGGDIVAMAVGDLDLDERPDLLVVEEPGGGEAVVWRLEYAP